MKFGILAHPVAHSLSPPMQNAAFADLQIDAHFERFDFLPENLAEFITTVRQEPISGLAVSLPHKEAIIPLLDYVTPTAQTIGAVNTVFWHDKKLCGDNTDAAGFWEAIISSTDFSHPKNALVVGAGGAARAIIFILRQNGVEVTIANRTLSKAKTLVESFSAQVCSMDSVCARDFDLVINSTSVGLKSTQSPVAEVFWQGFSGLAFDAVFDPLVTKFLVDAKTAGAKIVTGETMLLYQGIRQFEIWTGKNAPIKVMRKALDRELAAKTKATS